MEWHFRAQLATEGCFEIAPLMLASFMFMFSCSRLDGPGSDVGLMLCTWTALCG